ncbi:hypothetical protein TNCV_3943431 [Trichonephila clavipes]|nr:hypothetical protein TNCV_3943431 [Trichonephila clavipes]
MMSPQVVDNGKTIQTAKTKKGKKIKRVIGKSLSKQNKVRTERGKGVLWNQMNSLAASVKLTYSASMVDRLTDFCLKVLHEIGVSSIKVMNPPIDTRSSLFVAKSESE